MAMLEKTVRPLAITVAVLFIVLSLFGIVGVWLVDRRATEIALKGFGLVETAVGVVDAGVARVDDLIATSRTEVRQASETITAVGARPEANSPVLNALNERLETSLAPRIAQMQQALAPVRDAVGTIGNAVSLVNSLPMMADRAPRLAALDETFNRLEGLSADSTQLRGTLRALVGAQTSESPPRRSPRSTGSHSASTRDWARCRPSVQEVQADSPALQVRLDARKSRVLFVFNLLALLIDADAGLDSLLPDRRHPALPTLSRKRAATSLLFIVLNGPLGIGESTACRSADQTHRLPRVAGRGSPGGTEPPGGRRARICYSTTIELLVAHHRRFGYRHFVMITCGGHLESFRICVAGSSRSALIRK